MPLKPIDGFLDSSYELAATQASCQRLLNLFPEMNAVGTEKSVGYLRGAAGLSTPLVTLPTYPVRAMCEVGAPLGNDSRCFVVAGQYLYEVFAGTVTTNGTAVTWASGSPFTFNLAGQTIVINNVTYTISGAPSSSTALTLTASAGVQAVPVTYGSYYRRGYTGTCSISVTAGVTTVTSTGGAPFPDGSPAGQPTLANQPVIIDGAPYIVASDPPPTATTIYINGSVISGGTWTTGANVGNDGFPAQILPNGNQVGIVSAGNFYCDNGLGPYPTEFTVAGTSRTDISIGWAGNCAAGILGLTDAFCGKASTTNGSATVTWDSGDTFTAAFAGQTITIGLTTYTVLTYNSSTSLTLTANATATTITGGVVYVSGAPTGDPAFNKGMVGLPIAITGVSGGLRTINAVTSNTQLSLTQPTGLLPIPAAETYSVPSSSVLVYSQAMPFTAGDVGSTLDFASTIGFTGGLYEVLSVDAYGNATLGNAMSGLPMVVGAIGATGGQATQSFGAVTAKTGTYLDSFFIVNPPNSPYLYISNPLDGTTWDPTEYATKEGYPDHIGFLLADHQELFVAGESHSEVWNAPGADPTFPYQPNEAYSMSLGTTSPWSGCSLRDGPVWIGSSLRGQPIAYFAGDFQPVPISTPAVEQAWAAMRPLYVAAALPMLYDAQAFIWELDGHEFWQIGFPVADQTWVYDRTASVQMGKPIWHERNSFDGSNFHRHRASCYAFTLGGQYVGDFAASGYGAGNIYLMSDAIYEDNNYPITCIRTFPHICAQRLRQFFQKLQLDLQTAAGGVALTITVTWSDDGGVTFVGGGSNFTYVTSTTLTLDRAAFWQLGSADDRVFSISVTGAGPIKLINAYLDVLEGVS